VQELVEPERVLNVVNVPVAETTDGVGGIAVRVRTTPEGLYPDIELVGIDNNTVVGRFSVSSLADVALKQLVQHEDHVVRWPGTESRQATPYPEVVTLAKGDRVRFREWAPSARRFIESEGVIQRIDKIADGLPYQEAGHWDLTRWRFYIALDEYTQVTFVPQATTDIRLDRRN
jgi:hypothetical protein